MQYRLITENDTEKMVSYLIENKSEIIPSAIEQMYANPQAVSMRVNRGMEIVAVAEDENNNIKGLISAISPTMDQNWTIVAMHTIESERRNKCATKMLELVESRLKEVYSNFKLSASVYKTNRVAAAYFIINEFDLEGTLNALNSNKTILAFGKIIK